MAAVYFWRSAACWGVAALMIAGCAHAPKPKTSEATTPAPASGAAATPPTPQFTATPGLDPQARLRKLIELLETGQRDQARVEAQALLKAQPENTVAANLLNQIDSDPKATLGEQSFAYRIRPGETLATLAERYLGDRYMFYALSRYNGIDAPDQARVGQTIQIPGAPRRLTAAPPPRRRRTEPAEAARRPPEAAPTLRPATDPARANALRSQALVQMNKGAIDRAVTLLREAVRLDPANTAIAADLARAERIQAATRH